MEMVLLMLLSGILLGYILRKGKRVARTSERLTTWTIWLLLFLMGLSVGTNPTLLSHLHSIGTEALAISLSSVAGSIAAAWLLHRLLFRHQPNIPEPTNNPEL